MVAEAEGITASSGQPSPGREAMSDVNEIEVLLRAYAATYDARDVEAFAALFTEDGVVVQGGQETIGRERLARLVQRTPPSSARHYPEPPTIEVEGETATADSRFRYDTGQGQSITGGYADQLRRTAGGWLLSRRLISIDPSVGT
jgi:ketosteroid isomerase-like protein